MMPKSLITIWARVGWQNGGGDWCAELNPYHSQSLFLVSREVGLNGKRVREKVHFDLGMSKNSQTLLQQSNSLL